MSECRRGLRPALLAGMATTYLLLASATSAAAAPTSLVVFGDSLSDVGNISSATLSIVPGSHYYQGRFSNGPVWVERLSTELGLGPIQRSTAGGLNYAYGGARTTGSTGFPGLFILDLDEQVTQYLNQHPVADPAAMYVVFAGANDLMGGVTDVNVPLNQIVADVGRLVTAGARQVVVANLPLLGLTPAHYGDAGLSARTAAFNSQLETRIESFATSRLDVQFYRLDVKTLFANAVSNPAAWGLVNVRNPAAPGLSPGTGDYNDDNVVDHPEQYLFWDDVHPTAPIHVTLGQTAARLIAGAPGDVDADGIVDSADLVRVRRGYGNSALVLRQGDGTRDGYVDGADLLLWQRHVGDSIYTPPGALLAIPEPAAAILAALAVVGAVRFPQNSTRSVVGSLS